MSFVSEARRTRLRAIELWMGGDERTTLHSETDGWRVIYITAIRVDAIILLCTDLFAWASLYEQRPVPAPSGCGRL